MATFDKADPRWLVKDMGDAGKNVNNWHWVETDAVEWSRHRLSELCTDLPLLEGNDALSLKVTGLTSLGGEAVINNRKNKIIPSYELEVKLGWAGEIKGADGSSTAAKGTIHLPYIADENHDEEPEVKFGVEVEDAASKQLKEAFMSKGGKKVLLGVLGTFVSELRAGGPALSGPPAEAKADAAPKVKLSSADKDQVAKTSTPAAAASTKAKKASSSRSSLTIKETFYCRSQDLFECFTVEGRIRAFTQSPATVEARVGGAFSWFGGSVQGEFTQLEPGKLVGMKWRFSSWEEGCYSQVALQLEEPEPGTTVCTMKQTGLPEANKFGSEDVLENTDKGWRGQIFIRIRQVFGYGVGL